MQAHSESEIVRLLSLEDRLGDALACLYAKRDMLPVWQWKAKRELQGRIAALTDKLDDISGILDSYGVTR
jgi:hypothetical protein